MHDLTSYVERRGFEVLHAQVFAPAQVRVFAGELAATNWLGDSRQARRFEKGFGVIVAFNPNPKRVEPQSRDGTLNRGHTDLADALIAEALYPQHLYRGAAESRHASRLQVPAEPARNNALLDLLFSEEAPRIRRSMLEIRRACTRPEPVMQSLTRHGLRASVDLIDDAGCPAVRKVYRPSQRRFLHREILARTKLARQVPASELLDHGDNWMITAFHDDALRFSKRQVHLLPMPVVRRAFAALRRLHDAGYCLLDFTPLNILADRSGAVTFIDLEFLQAYEVGRPAFAEHYALAGVPASFRGDVPAGRGKTYSSEWLPWVGLRLDSLLHESAARQHLRRACVRLARRSRVPAPASLKWL